MILFLSQYLETELRRTTIRDVAEKANVSPSTVSLFIRGRAGVSDETGQRIAAVIEKLKYEPRRRSNHQSENALVGFLIERFALSAFSDIFYGEVIHGLEAQAKEAGWGVMFSVIEDDQSPRMVTENQVRGLLILGGSTDGDALAVRLTQQGFPVVLVDNYVLGLRVNCVVPDNRWGGYMAFKHLVDSGHERIAIIEGPRKYKTLTDRLDGALRAAEDSGLTLRPEYRQPDLSSGQPKKGYLEMKRLLALPEPPTAVFAVSDKTAFGALEAVKEAGLRVPTDISLVGFDDVAQTTPPLTTIHVPKYEMGVLAMQQLLEIIEGRVETPVRTGVYTHLVIRDSTARLEARA